MKLYFTRIVTTVVEVSEYAKPDEIKAAYDKLDLADHNSSAIVVVLDEDGKELTAFGD